MNSKLIIQSEKENTIISKIAECFENNPKKVYILCSTLKEDGFKLLEDCFIDTKSELFIALGIDKKNTTKIMLDSLLEYTKEVYYYNNNELVEFNGSLVIFEYKDNVVIYNLCSNFSENGLEINDCVYFETIYNLKENDEKKQYKEMIKTLTDKIKNSEEKFQKLTLKMANKLQEDKVIFTTKQYIHNVKSISELLGKDPVSKSDKKDMTKDEADDIYISNTDIPKIDLDLDDLSFDDIDMSQVSDNNVELNDNGVIEKSKATNKEDKKLKTEDLKEEPQIDEVLKNIEDIVDANNIENSEENDEEFDENDTLDISQMLFSKGDLKLDINNDEKLKKEK